jgi:hypothetical protein
MDPQGKLVMESILETQAATILEFFTGLRGTLRGPGGRKAAWLLGNNPKVRVAEPGGSPDQRALVLTGTLPGGGDLQSENVVISHPNHLSCVPWARPPIGRFSLTAPHRKAP